MFFKEVVQAVILFRSYTWVLSPPHGTGPGKLPEHNCQTYNGEAAKATRGRGMELPTAGDSDGGGAF